jgi:CheY-like chemotaxis protein
MSKRILFIESDLQFANEMKLGFESVGASVEIATDGPTGLERAVTNKPDLIILTIELPGMNGFLVCKKIKKTVELPSVPLIILSSEASEETFEQHKKLKTHADDYLHKPVAVEEVIEHARQYIPLGTEEIKLDPDAVELKEDDLVLQNESVPPPPHSDATDVMAGERWISKPAVPIEPFERSERPLSVEPELEIESVRPSSTPFEGEQEGAGIFSIPARSSLPEIIPLNGATERDIVELQRELEGLKHQLASTESALQEARAAKGRESGISGREFLDLRERLNRKDRELLDLRDQITARDKQLVEANDNLLKIARELEDAKDRHHVLGRELDKAKALVETLNADKETSKKRSDDLKARLDRTDAKLKSRETELAQLESARAKEIEELKNEMARRLAEESDARHAALEQLRENLQSDAAEKLREVEEAHRSQLQSAHSKSEEESRAVREQLEAQHANDMQTLRDQLETQYAAETQTLREQLEAHYAAEIQAQREQIEAHFAAENQARDQEHLKEMARLNRNLFETENKLTAAEERLGRLQTEESSVREALGKVTAEYDAKTAELAEAVARHQQELETVKHQHDQQYALVEERARSLTSSLEVANQKLDNDRQLFERVRESIVAGLALIDQRERP